MSDEPCNADEELGKLHSRELDRELNAEYSAMLDRQRRYESAALLERIRKALLFGHIPSMPDLLSWWEATTGEKIEHGRRCDACNGVGKQFSELTLSRVECPACSNGYSVRPTWMETQTQNQKGE